MIEKYGRPLETARRTLGKLRNRCRLWRASFVPRRVVCQRKIAVCFATLNRSGTRVRNCLQSVREQSVPEEQVEIVIADMGSSPDQEESLRSLASDYKAKLILLKTPSREWNRAWTMNCAIRASSPETDVVLASDVDCLFGRNCMEELLRVHLVLPGRVFGICGITDLPKGTVRPSTDILKEFDEIRQCGAIERDVGIGACQSFWREWVFAVHGYDERYCIYGYEDNDMERRAGRANLWFANVTGRTAILHQWHEPTRSSLSAGREQRFKDAVENNRKMYETATGIVRNASGWGQRPPQSLICGHIV